MDLTLALPCYKEEEHIEESVADLITVMEKTRLSYEIIFVNDASPDATQDILEKICAENKQCRLISHDVNRGRGAAFKSGFKEAKGDVVGFIDVDMEVHPRYIPSLVNLILYQGYDIATGHRYYLLSQTGGLSRYVLSVAYRFLCYVCLGLDVKDSETGCKFFKRSSTHDVVLGSDSDGWFWDTEVMSRASLLNLNIKEMAVLFLRRYDKTSTVNVIPDSIGYLQGLWHFRPKVGLAMLDRSPVYWSARGYDLAMKILLGKRYYSSYQDVADLIPKNCSVVDVCSGSSFIYKKFLKEKNCQYTALDMNGHFIMSARKHGIDARLFNILENDPPQADYIVMLSSFYHFRDQKERLFETLMGAANKTLILSEPVVNLSEHSSGALASLANRLTNPGSMSGQKVGNYKDRYDLESFEKFAKSHNCSAFLKHEDSNNAIAVFTK